MGLVGLIFSSIGITLGALLIIIGNLTTEYTEYMWVQTCVPIFFIWPIPVSSPNFPATWIGFAVMGLALILLGSASIAVREMTGNPSASLAAGILSIIGAGFFITGFLIYYSILTMDLG